MQPIDDDIIRALEGKPSVQQEQQNDAIVRAMEGRSTQKSNATFATAQASLAVEAYAESLCRSNPAMTLAKARETANDSLERFVQLNRDKYATEKDLMEAAINFLARAWLNEGAVRRKKTMPQRASADRRKTRR